MTKMTKSEFLQVCKIRANIYEGFISCLPSFAPALEKFDGKVLNKKFLDFAAGNEHKFGANGLTVRVSINSVGSCQYIELYCSEMFRESWRSKLIEIKTSFEVSLNNGRIDGMETVKNLVEKMKWLEGIQKDYEDAISNFPEVEKAISKIEQEKSRIAKVNTHLQAYLLGYLMSY